MRFQKNSTRQKNKKIIPQIFPPGSPNNPFFRHAKKGVSVSVISGDFPKVGILLETEPTILRHQKKGFRSRLFPATFTKCQFDSTPNSLFSGIRKSGSGLDHFRPFSKSDHSIRYRPHFFGTSKKGVSVSTTSGEFSRLPILFETDPTCSGTETSDSGLSHFRHFSQSCHFVRS